MPALKLPLPDSPRLVAFRAVEAILRASPDLVAAIAADQWGTFDGDAFEIMEFGTGTEPAVMLSIAESDGQWWSPDTIESTLTIDVAFSIPSLLLDDVENLWWAVVRAFYPANPQLADPSPSDRIQSTLRAAGATTGLVMFSKMSTARVAPDDDADGRFLAYGQLTLDVNMTINP
jgi:hypothetical protein